VFSFFDAKETELAKNSLCSKPRDSIHKTGTSTMCLNTIAAAQIEISHSAEQVLQSSICDETIMVQIETN
jgi:hypothetical protein